MWNRGFAGWYYKHQRQDDMIAFIPGRAESGAFVQMLTPEGSRQFLLPELSITGDSVRAGGCLFSPDGCQVDLPGVRGEIVYGKLTPLRHVWRRADPESGCQADPTGPGQIPAGRGDPPDV